MNREAVCVSRPLFFAYGGERGRRGWRDAKQRIKGWKAEGDPETTHVPDNTVKTRTVGEGQVEKYTGYTVRKKMLEGIEFEETHDSTLKTT